MNTPYAPHTSLFAATTSGTFWASPAGGTVPTTTPVVTTGVATGVDDGAAVAGAAVPLIIESESAP